MVIGGGEPERKEFTMWHGLISPSINWVVGVILLGASIFFGLWSLYVVVCTDDKRFIYLAGLYAVLLLSTIVAAHGIA